MANLKNTVVTGSVIVVDSYTKLPDLWEPPDAGKESGAIWFDNRDFTVRVRQRPIGVWTAGSPMTSARYSLAGAGTQNEALAFGGSPPYPVLKSL